MTDAARSPGRSGRAWRTVQAQVYQGETHCWLCFGWVDQTLPVQRSKARSADHLVQLCHGGQPLARTNLRLAHRGCNSARSNRLRKIERSRCACSQGQPCAVLTQRVREYLSVDASSV